jgi:hypothetical protein
LQYLVVVAVSISPQNYLSVLLICSSQVSPLLSCRFLILSLLFFLCAGGATLIFDTELVSVNGKPGSKSDEEEDVDSDL